MNNLVIKIKYIANNLGDDNLLVSSSKVKNNLQPGDLGFPVINTVFTVD